MDVYIDIAPRYKIWVQDITPFLRNSHRLENALFPWEEIESKIEEKKAEKISPTEEEVIIEIRTADSAS